MISVLIPSYNYARFLPIAASSVLAYPNAVPIVMDGESTDGTVDWLRSAPKPTVWRSEHDKGQSDALNKALRLASSDIIGWLNADDFYLPGSLRIIDQAFADNPDVDVIFGDVVFVDEHERVLRLVSGYRGLEKLLPWRGSVLMSTATFMRRKALPEDPWDPDLRVLMDWDLYLRLLRNQSKFLHIPTPLAAFRIHAAQVTSAPLPKDSVERQIVRDRHNLVNPENVRILAGSVVHKLLKIASGAYARERAWRSVTGKDLLTSDRKLNPHVTHLLGEST